VLLVLLNFLALSADRFFVWFPHVTTHPGSAVKHHFKDRDRSHGARHVGARTGVEWVVSTFWFLVQSLHKDHEAHVLCSPSIGGSSRRLCPCSAAGIRSVSLVFESSRR
jgi:hypothetical protein